MNAKAVADVLVREEGEVLHYYEDHLGYATIGVGRLIDKRKGGGISRVESRMLLANDMKRAEDAAKKYGWYHELSENRQGCIVLMIFQMGATAFAGFRRTHALIAAGDYEGASKEMLNSKWAEQTPERAHRVSVAFRTGVLE